MISYSDILNTFTRILNKNYSDIDIYVSRVKQGFEGSCFFVKLIPTTNDIATLETNTKVIIIDIQYMSDDELNELNIKLEELERVFNRHIKVNDRVLKFRNIESEIVEDELGYILHYMITIDYDEEVIIEKEEYDLMKELILDIK